MSNFLTVNAIFFHLCILGAPIFMARFFFFHLKKKKKLPTFFCLQNFYANSNGVSTFSYFLVYFLIFGSIIEIFIENFVGEEKVI
jgi:hypothetical protein